MNPNDIVRVDGLKWWTTKSGNGVRVPVPLCPQHDLRLKPVLLRYYNSSFRKYFDHSSDKSIELECAEGPHKFPIPRPFSEEKQYILDRIDALVFKKMSILNLDEESILVADEAINKKGNPYWVKARITESKAGTRLIVWAGDKSKKNKTQLFVEPDIKRLSFDQNDSHPIEVFAKVEATFIDTKTSIEKKK